MVDVYVVLVVSRWIVVLIVEGVGVVVFEIDLFVCVEMGCG